MIALCRNIILMNNNCKQCKSGKKLDFEIAMAFQPIVNLNTFECSGYEALVRGPQGQGAFEVFKQVNDDNRYLFDQACRRKAIETAAKLKLTKYLSINFMPNAVYEPARCIQTTLNAAKAHNFPLEKIVFEFTESEEMVDKAHLVSIIKDYKKRGFLTAIDDFGAGYSGLNMLCEVDTDIVKIDRQLIIDINEDPRRQTILQGMFNMLTPITKRVIVEGVETIEELKCLYGIGFRYFQGYYFARPGFEELPQVDFPTIKKLLS